jgi:hypothetical protein
MVGGLLLAAGASRAMFGQGTGPLIAGPSLGFVYDRSSQSLKPLLGNAGAAMIGPALDLGTAFSSAVISPKQDYALAVAGGNNVVLVRLDGATPPSSILSVLPPSPDQIALSPGGGSAALYYAATRSFQVITGLPDSPAFTSLAAAALPATPDVLAVSDDGKSVLAGLGGDSGEVYLLTDGSTERVLQAGRISAIAFLHQSQDALVVDGGGRRLLRISKGSGGIESQVLARETDGIADAAAVTASADNRLALVANTGAASVVVVNLASGAASAVACQCTPTILAGLRGQAVYRLNELSEFPISVLDVGGAKPVVNVIPPEVKLLPEVMVRVPGRGVRQ